MRKTKKGLFIVLEGADYSGKSTLADLLEEELRKNGRRAVSFYDPFIEDFRIKSIKDAILDKANKDNPFAIAGLFAAARNVLYYDYIEPRLMDGQDIICDRYKLSSYVYQNKAGCSYEFLDSINKMPDPDIILYLSISADEFEKRKTQRGQADSLDPSSVDDFLDLQNRYEELLYSTNRCRFMYLDGNKSKNNLVEDAMKSLKILM